LVIEERADPVPGPGEILVRVHASSLNFHDFFVVMGMSPTDDGRIPMSDGAGEVIAVGEGASKFNKGDQVISLFFPTWLTGSTATLGFDTTRIPQGYSATEAATLSCAALTAWRGMFVEGSVKPGDWVLTQGTGGVSVFALQFAKAAGARVISTSSSDEKLERMKALGADHVINYNTTPEWGNQALEITGGRGVDEVVEVGGAGTMAQSIVASRVGGHISLIGVLTGISGEIPTAAFLTKNLTMSGITVGSAEHQEQMIAAIDVSGIKPVLDKDFPLDQIAGAFAHQASQKHFGKITLSI